MIFKREPIIKQSTLTNKNKSTNNIILYLTEIIERSEPNLHIEILDFIIISDNHHERKFNNFKATLNSKFSEKAFAYDNCTKTGSKITFLKKITRSKCSISLALMNNNDDIAVKN